jgi:hypothetical protein
MRNAWILAAAGAMFLSGCAQKMAYVRIDGQRAATDPVLAQQFEVDRTICSGEMQKANVSGVTFSGGGLAGIAAQVERQNAVGQVAQGCMASRGYLSVPEDQAAAKAAELAAVAEEKKRRELAAAAPPAPPASSAKKTRAAATIQQ